jgi:predicted outer membrane repeat protein
LALSVLVVTDTQFLSNTTRWDGGGVYVVGATQLNGGLFQNNQSTNGLGGGLLALSALVVTDTQFLSNTAGVHGGGVRVTGAAQIVGGLFQHNQSTSGSGGGLLALSALVVTNTQFLSNTASVAGGGLSANNVTRISGGLFQNNQSTNGSGGGLFANSTLALTSTQFLWNTAQQGGGLYHAAGNGRLVNALLAGNVANNTFGAALFLTSTGTVAIIHTTIASPTVANASAIKVNNGTVGITNTIVASHTIGINQVGGSVFEDYNLFFGNGTNLTGTVASGGNSSTGNPHFANPVAHDYHLTLGSAALDVGINADVTSDFEGDSRLQGIGFDIGYDELRRPLIYLPLVVR